MNFISGCIYNYFDDTGLPVVTVIPSSQSVEVTLTATFTTMVTGVGSESFTYQWQHNRMNISGGTDKTLTIPNVTLTDAGVYTCVVMNQYGDSNSSLASLIVAGMYIWWERSNNFTCI